ncbi:response regulator transcription factor [Novosphingobium sp.]|jgi:DNA-binding NarL/FixJ family response regulator|uniref:response regulator transcription factor n=1 Tax=Novosphingobium sp. TaxID=1874826 RepID=UPI002FE297B2
MIRVLVVDDHPVVCEGLSAIIDNEEDLTIAGTAGDGIEAVHQFSALRPDVTLMDMQMPRATGAEAIATILAEAPSARIIVLSTYAGDASAARALKIGAAGYMLKSSARKVIAQAIRDVHAGKRFIDAAVASEIAIHVGERSLTPRETQVLAEAARGNGNREIARLLGISEETVKDYFRTAYAKLNVSDRTHAVMEALRRGMLTI